MGLINLLGILLFLALALLVACDEHHIGRALPDPSDASLSDTLPDRSTQRPSSGGGTPPVDKDPLEHTDTTDIADDDQAEPDQCNRTPQEPTNVDAYPCCFSDQDCFASPYPDTGVMRCYGYRCREGGEGVCRHMPFDPDSCWADRDCLPNQICSSTPAVVCGEVPGERQMGRCKLL